MEVNSSTVFNQKPVYFPQMGWAYITSRWECQPNVYALGLSNLQFSFQGLTQDRIPQCASIVKAWLYKSITEQSSRRITQLIALPP